MKVLGLLFLLLVLFAGEANACSCAGPGVPCQAYWDASAVFVGTVSYSSSVTLDEGNYQRSQRVVRFTLEEVFRGITGTEAEVMTGLGGGDCGYGFRLGGQYLVYAYRDKDDKLHTGICTRTRLISEAADDIAYVRGLGKAKPGATIFGEVKRLDRNAQWEERLKPVMGAEIAIEGPSKRVKATTDSKGQYRVSGLPSDTYKVRVEPPDGLSIYNVEREAKVSDRGCALISFWLEADTRITGKVFDGQGQPASDVLMELVPTTAREDNAFPIYVRTDKDGKYEMRLVKPGSYRLGVRIFGSAGATYVPFPRTYHPGVSEETGATIFTITEGQRIEAVDLILPPRLVERTLNGVVVSQDGRPVQGAVVWLKEREYSDGDMPYRKETDGEGRFSFKVYEGFKYTLNAYIEAKTDGEQKRSEIMEVRVSENPGVVKLVLTNQK